MTKYQQTFQTMLEENKQLFSEFISIHQKYLLSPRENQGEFNRVGARTISVIKQYENRLCGKSEKGIYANFSGKLAEKFWDLVRKKFPKIDFVGVKVIKTSVRKPKTFEFKKISFS